MFSDTNILVPFTYSPAKQNGMKLKSKQTHTNPKDERGSTKFELKRITQFVRGGVIT